MATEAEVLAGLSAALSAPTTEAEGGAVTEAPAAEAAPQAEAQAEEVPATEASAEEKPAPGYDPGKAKALAEKARAERARRDARIRELETAQANLARQVEEAKAQAVAELRRQLEEDPAAALAQLGATDPARVATVLWERAIKGDGPKAPAKAEGSSEELRAELLRLQAQLADTVEVQRVAAVARRHPEARGIQALLDDDPATAEGVLADARARVAKRAERQGLRWTARDVVEEAERWYRARVEQIWEHAARARERLGASAAEAASPAAPPTAKAKPAPVPPARTTKAADKEEELLAYLRRARSAAE